MIKLFFLEKSPFGLLSEKQKQKLPNYIKNWSLRVYLIENFYISIYIINSLKYPFFNFFNSKNKKNKILAYFCAYNLYNMYFLLLLFSIKLIKIKFSIKWTIILLYLILFTDLKSINRAKNGVLRLYDDIIYLKSINSAIFLFIFSYLIAKNTFFYLLNYLTTISKAFWGIKAHICI